jgi:hypothetical protein
MAAPVGTSCPYRNFTNITESKCGRNNYMCSCIVSGMRDRIIIRSQLNTRRRRKGKEKLSLCLTNEALRHRGILGNGCIDPYIVDIGTR